MAEPRCAVVLSGGGAKGVFESGVIHAFTQVGLEADVVTGSSVGAVNAVAYAESIRQGRLAGTDAGREVTERILSLWQGLDREKVADLDGWGWRVWVAAGAGVFVGLALGIRAIAGAPRAAGIDIFELILFLGLGVVGILAGGWLARSWIRLPKLLRDRIQKGLPGPPMKSDSTPGAAPQAESKKSAGLDLALRWLGLTPSLFGGKGLRRALARVVPETRRLSEFRESGVEVRLTRTNLRTGRTEVSEHLDLHDTDRPGFDRGRRVLGDPRAVPAALASSAFPSLFPPIRADRIYERDENRTLYGRLTERALSKQELRRVFGSQAKTQYIWLMTLLDDWAEKDPELFRSGGEARLYDRIRASFYGERHAWSKISARAILVLVETRGWPQMPLPGERPYSDRYFDGGILDNTPLSSALSALREGDAEGNGSGPSAADRVHDVFVVLLAPRPRRRYVPAAIAEKLDGPALGMRALRLQAERRLEDDLRMAEKIDRLLAEKGLDKEEPAHGNGEERTPASSAARAESATSTAVATASGSDSGPQPESWAEIFERERGGSPADLEPMPAPAAERLVRVRVTRIYPTWDLPWLLALDDRLGFEAEQARLFQARGCRDTLLALRDRYAADGLAREPMPDFATAALRLVGGNWGDAPQPGWVCRAERCSLRSACDRAAVAEAQDKTLLATSVSSS